MSANGQNRTQKSASTSHAGSAFRNTHVEQKTYQVTRERALEPPEDVTTLTSNTTTKLPSTPSIQKENSRKRKRFQPSDNIESEYFRKLASQEEKREVLASEGTPKRHKQIEEAESPGDAKRRSSQEPDSITSDEDAGHQKLSEFGTSHETISGAIGAIASEQERALRTVFLGNVSIDAITSKSARKALLRHVSSHFDLIPTDKALHKIESLRFRSTAYSSAGPKRAAFAKKELMERTTKSTNAYVVYSNEACARHAPRYLNGSMILDRHLRVDAIASPAQQDNRRCVFVGNLRFVDAESQNQEAEQNPGKSKKNKAKEGDAEEGLWRQFGKAGTVESVRVIRDSKSRVSKGVAYVQFEDVNAVEEALLYNDKAFPPMLPRKLRVVRAKRFKHQTGAAATPNSVHRLDSNGESNRPRNTHPKHRKEDQKAVVYHESDVSGRSRTNEDTTSRGKHAHPQSASRRRSSTQQMQSSVFEGHRASSKRDRNHAQRKGATRPRIKRPENRSARRGAAWKVKGKGE